MYATVPSTHLMENGCLAGNHSATHVGNSPTDQHHRRTALVELVTLEVFEDELGQRFLGHTVCTSVAGIASSSAGINSMKCKLTFPTLKK